MRAAARPSIYQTELSFGSGVVGPVCWDSDLGSTAGLVPVSSFACNNDPACSPPLGACVRLGPPPSVTVTVQGTALEGHKLVLQLSSSQGGASAGAKAKAAKAAKAAKDQQQQGGAKLVVRNLAFEATRK